MPADDGESVARKAAAARVAQPAWAAEALSRRLASIRRFGELLRRDRQTLAATLTGEMGKPIRQSRAELASLDGRLAYFLERTPAVLEDEVVAGSAVAGGPADSPEERISYEPLGVVANISAWNYPYFVGSNVFVPALLAGNAVLYKPSEHATLTGLAIAERLREAGVPPDVFGVVVGGPAAGEALLRQEVDGVFFTGSWTTGQRIATAVGGRMIPLQLELGGKDPVYVCDDVLVEEAAASLVEGVFYNAGQSCCAVERLYVHRRVAAEFVDRFVAAARELVVGDPFDERTDVGPLARAEQLDLLETQVEDAVQRGARLLLGGRRRQGAGWFFEPTVLAGVDHDMGLMREESFGPIIGIQEVADDEHAVRLMNDTDYGLTAGVYTRDRLRAQRILARVNAGTAYWNCCDRVSPRLPWSGRKRSGIGATLSEAGIRAFVRPKAWHLRPA